MLSKLVSCTIFWVFGMTWLWIEPQSPIYIYIHTHLGSHGKQHGEHKGRWTQQQVNGMPYMGVGQIDPTGQWSGSNSLIGELLFHWKITIAHTQTTSPNCIALCADKKRVWLGFEPWPQCSKNQLQSSN